MAPRLRAASRDSRYGPALSRSLSPRQTVRPTVVASAFDPEPNDANQIRLQIGDIVDKQYSDPSGWAYGRLLTHSSFDRSPSGTFEETTDGESTLAGWFPEACLSKGVFQQPSSRQESSERGRSEASICQVQTMDGSKHVSDGSLHRKGTSEKVSRCPGGKSTASRSSIRARQKNLLEQKATGDDAAKRWALTARLWSYLDAQEKLCMDQLKGGIDGSRKELSAKLAVLRDKKAAAGRALREVQTQMSNLSPANEVGGVSRAASPRRLAPKPQRQTSAARVTNKVLASASPRSARFSVKETTVAVPQESAEVTRSVDASPPRSACARVHSEAPEFVEKRGPGSRTASALSTQAPAIRPSTADGVTQAVRSTAMVPPPTLSTALVPPSTLTASDSTSTIASAVLKPPPAGMTRIFDEAMKIYDEASLSFASSTTYDLPLSERQASLSFASSSTTGELPVLERQDDDLSVRRSSSSFTFAASTREKSEFPKEEVDDEDEELKDAQRALEESLSAVTESGRRVAELRRAWVDSGAGDDKACDAIDAVEEEGGQCLSQVLELVEDLPERWEHMCIDEREKLLKRLARPTDEEEIDGAARAG